MKNYILIIVLSYVAVLNIEAQEKGKVIFRENFDDNKNNWNLQPQKWEHAVHPSRYIATISNGAYHIKAMTKGIFKGELGGRTGLTSYTLETAIRLKLTTENGLFYLRWKEGKKGNELYYFFGINKNGNYKLATDSLSYYSFGSTTIKEGQIPKESLRKTNVLKIEVKSSVVYYYINDYLLYSFFDLDRSSNPQPLDNVDFVIFNPDRGKFELFGGSVDYLEIRENDLITNPKIQDTISITNNAITSKYVKNWDKYQKISIGNTPNGQELISKYTSRRIVLAPSEPRYRAFSKIYLKEGKIVIDSFQIRNPRRIQMEHIDISKDRKVLLIQSQYNDIYISKWNSLTKRYAKPYSIASKGFRPYFGVDDQSIYFATVYNGFFDVYEYPNTDIMVSQRLGKGWEKWSMGKNMGHYINTAQYNERVLMVSKEGLFFYEQDYKGHFSLYKATLKE